MIPPDPPEAPNAQNVVGPPETSETLGALDALRRRIDDVDRRLVLILARRQRLVEAAAAIKGSPDAVRNPARERAVLDHVRTVAAAAGLSPAVALPLWRLMIAAFTRHQIDWLSRPAPASPPDTTGSRQGSNRLHPG